MISKDLDNGAVLDHLYLEMLTLIEQQVGCKLNIERNHNSGQMLLAKTRYIQGTQSVGLAQIPTDQSPEFNALCKVEETPCEDAILGTEITLLKNELNSENGYVEPLKWFSALPPRSLRLASEQFKKSIELIVESVNIQHKLQAVMFCILELKKSIMAK